MPGDNTDHTTTQPMEQSTYEQLLDRLAKQDAKIAEYEKRLTEVINFNKALVSTTGDSQPASTETKPNASELLTKYLKERKL